MIHTIDGGIWNPAPIASVPLAQRRLIELAMISEAHSTDGSAAARWPASVRVVFALSAIILSWSAVIGTVRSLI